MVSAGEDGGGVEEVVVGVEVEAPFGERCDGVGEGDAMLPVIEDGSFSSTVWTQVPVVTATRAPPVAVARSARAVTGAGASLRNLRDDGASGAANGFQSVEPAAHW